MTNWADVTNSKTGEWLSWADASRIHGLSEGGEREMYERMLLELRGGGDDDGIRSRVRRQKLGAERRRA